jgi:hypothetical protein
MDRSAPEAQAMVAPCGIDCGQCEAYTAKDNPELLNYLVSVGIRKDRLPCAGCRQIKGDCPVLETTCATYRCASDRGYVFCYECHDFPCSCLNPAADRAAQLPHNTKVFNLCYIQRQGIDRFLEKSADIKKRYFKGKMVVGEGPQVAD